MKKWLALALLLPGVSFAQQFVAQGAGSVATTGSGAAITPSLPASCPTGGLMLAYTTHLTNSATIAAVAGWTEIHTQGTSGSAKILARIKQSGDTTGPTIDWSGTNSAIAQVACWSGNIFTDLANVVAHVQTGSSSSSTSLTYPALTVSTANTLVIIAGRHNKSNAIDGVSVNAEAGFTEIGESANSGNGTQVFVWNYQIQTTATNVTSGTWDPTVSFEASASNSVTISLKSATVTTPVFDVAPTVSSKTAVAYTLSFDPDFNAQNIYCGAYLKDASAPTAAQIEAGTNAHGTATKATSGTADTVVLTPSEGTKFPVYDLYCALKGSAGYSSVATLVDQCLNAPAGKQFIGCPNGLVSIDTGSPLISFNSQVTPDLAAGDIEVCDASVFPATWVLTGSTDGQFIYTPDPMDPTIRQYANCKFYDLSANNYHAQEMDWWPNDEAPKADADDFEFIEGQTVSINICQLWSDREGDPFTVVNSQTGEGSGADTRPAGTVFGGAGNCLWTGTADEEGTGSFLLTATDNLGASEVVQFGWNVTAAEDPLVAPDCETAHLPLGSCTSLLSAAGLLFTITLDTDGVIAPGNVKSQNPAAGDPVDVGDTIALVVVRGASSKPRTAIGVGVR